jgi:hypothetical protein
MLFRINSFFKIITAVSSPSETVLELHFIIGRGIAQAVSRWLPTAEAQI